MAVVLHNSARVDEALVRRVLAASELPDARILLVLYERGGLMVGGAGPFPGFATHRPLLKYLGRLAAMFHKFPNDWEHAVVILQEALVYLDDHPAYFAFLLEHELDHVRVGAAGMGTAILANLIHLDIHQASGGAVTLHQETPEEVQCDKAGKRLAVELFGEDAFRKCVGDLEAAGEDEDKRMRFRYLRELAAAPFDTPLRQRLLEYVAPYRDELAKIWRRDAAENPDCMAAAYRSRRRC